MSGMNATTGRSLSGLDHIRQSIARILTTPVGACLERREFGSLLPDMIDAPLNDTTLMQAVAASAAAIARWEPRIRLTSLRLSQDAAAPSRLTIEMDATVLNTDTTVTLQLPISLGGLAV